MRGRAILSTCLLLTLLAVSLALMPELRQQSLTQLSRLSPEVKQVHLSADGPIDLNQMRQIAAIPSGSPLLFFSAKRVLARLRAHPLVDQATLSRRLNGVVHIDIQLRQPVAIVGGRGLTYTDSAGNTFKTLEPGDLLDFPIITGIQDGRTMIHTERQQVVKTALQLLQLTEEWFQQQGHTISEVHVDPTAGYSLFTNRVGGCIVLGMPPFENKVARMQRILERLEDRLFDIELLDLDYNSRAFVRWKHQGHQILAKKGW